MPRTAEDIENYLLRLDRRFERAQAEGGHPIFIVATGASLPAVAVQVAPPIVEVRVAIGPVPKDSAHQLALFRRLLELNATDLMHAAYGIEEGRVTLSSALALENLDVNELEAVLSDLDMALVQHVPSLLQAARD